MQTVVGTQESLYETDDPYPEAKALSGLRSDSDLLFGDVSCRLRLSSESFDDHSLKRFPSTDITRFSVRVHAGARHTTLLRLSLGRGIAECEVLYI